MVDLCKVIEIAKSKECIEFRNWLATTDEKTDAEILEAFQSLKTRLYGLLAADSGKAVRWAVGTGLGFISPAGPVLGAAAGLLDAFVLDKLISKRNPIAFLERKYRSIFDQ